MDARRESGDCIPRLFDLANREHIKELKYWCRIHFDHIICKSLKSANSSIFHDCCISFSKRGCLKRLSHPQMQAISIMRIPALRNANSPEELFEWLKSRMIQHANLGLQIHFPTINVAHFVSQDDSLESAEFLGKRVDKLTEELLKAELEVGKVKEENSKLLSSSKHWYCKYQELLQRIEDEKASYTQITPQKVYTSKETLTNETFFEI